MCIRQRAAIQLIREVTDKISFGEEFVKISGNASTATCKQVTVSTLNSSKIFPFTLYLHFRSKPLMNL